MKILFTILTTAFSIQSLAATTIPGHLLCGDIVFERATYVCATAPCGNFYLTPKKGPRTKVDIVWTNKPAVEKLIQLSDRIYKKAPYICIQGDFFTNGEQTNIKAEHVQEGSDGLTPTLKEIPRAKGRAG